MTEPASSRPPTAGPLGALGGTVVLFFVAFGVQMIQDGNYFDGDTGYHLAVAQLLAEHGFLQEFPWTRMSWLADHYADKELLFHVLMIPVAFLDPNFAARLCGAFFGGLALAGMYWILRTERVPRSLLWPLVALLSSGAFVHRFALVRPHLLSIPLAMLVLWASARKNTGWLFVACLLFPLSYTAWHLPIVLVGIVELARSVSQHRIEPASIVATLVGLGLGIVLHPNFPANLEFFWIQNVDVLLGTAWAGAEGFELGGEFKPYSMMGMVRYMTVPTLMGVVAVTLGWRVRKADVLPLAMALAALAFGVLTLKTQRFIEYQAPVSALALGLAWTAGPLCGLGRWPGVGSVSHGASRAGDSTPRWQLLPTGLLLLGLVWTAVLGTRPIEMLRGRTILFPPKVTAELQQAIPEGSKVVTCDWEFTGEMMLALPERSFLVALDPVFFFRAHPEAYRAWFSLVRTPPERPAAIARDVLDGEYVLCDSRERWRQFLYNLDQDPESAFVGRYGYWYVLRLLPAG